MPRPVQSRVYSADRCRSRAHRCPACGKVGQRLTEIIVYRRHPWDDDAVCYNIHECTCGGRIPGRRLGGRRAMKIDLAVVDRKRRYVVLAGRYRRAPRVISTHETLEAALDAAPHAQVTPTAITEALWPNYGQPYPNCVHLVRWICESACRDGLTSDEARTLLLAERTQSALGVLISWAKLPPPATILKLAVEAVEAHYLSLHGTHFNIQGLIKRTTVQ